MSVAVRSERSPQNVGEILIQVQDDLLELKRQLCADQDLQNVDLSSLESAISKTENGLKGHTEVLFRRLNDQVNILPTTQDEKPKTPSSGELVPTQQETRSGRALCQRRALQQELRRLTPGEQLREKISVKAIDNPHNAKNREVLNKSYGIQLPLIEKRTSNPNTFKVMKGTVVEPLTVLPRVHRENPQLVPPQITEKDAQKGLMSLINRGFIPPKAKIILQPSPVRHSTAILHNPSEKLALKLKSGTADGLGSIKFDSFADDEKRPRPPSVASRSVKSATCSTRNTFITELKVPLAYKNLDLHPMPPPTTPAIDSELPKRQTHRFPIQKGKTREDLKEFLAFKEHYCLSWGSIVSTLKHLEKMLTTYAVPIAFVNGDKLADLSLEFEMETPSTEALLSCIVNREDVEKFMCQPGRRFCGPQGQNIAAAKIQATWRMYKDRDRYLKYRKKKIAAGIICISWVLSMKLSKVRKQLAASRLDQLETFRREAKIFSKNWDRIKHSRRTVIHIPSLGYEGSVRSTMENFDLWQNQQMSRLCDIQDPDVDVIYVSAVHVNEEMQQYYSKLLGLKLAVESGDASHQSDQSNRYKIIVPEALNSFPGHNMCLASLLKYSPGTLKRIKNLIRGRDAYIVTGMPHKDDLHVADALGVPILCSEPEVAHMFSTKSGAKRIFSSAQVQIPPGERDIYSLPQLFETFAQLIVDNLEVTRWLFKLDSECDGRGTAFVDVAEHLQCYPWVLKESARYGDKWSKKWAQEKAYIKVHTEMIDLIEKAVPIDAQMFPTWEKFFETFVTKGGVIEACPPSESVTAVTVDMLIEPDGKVDLLCCGDQIHAETSLRRWVVSVPQSSVDPKDLNSACFSIAEVCRAKGVVGFISIDFVTFIHPKSLQQMLWAVDLNLSWSNSLSMFQLLKYTTGGRLDPRTQTFRVPLPNQGDSDAEPSYENRCAVMSTRLHHSNLSVIQYSVFFQMCKAHCIGYDLKDKQGSVFTLTDSTKRQRMGMLTIGSTLQGALTTFARNLSVIHQEISTPKMPGKSNFMAAIRDIEEILGTTILNAEDQSADVENGNDL